MTILKRGQILEGRVISQTTKQKFHKNLVKQIDSIILRARDSTLMDAEYDTRLIEDLFQCGTITITIPSNGWEESDHRGVNHERWFAVELYIDRLKTNLQRQGLQVVMEAVKNKLEV